MSMNVLFSVGISLFAAQQEDPPNILFILTDDHRPDGMGCYGNASLKTPTFDRIAREGARFDAFYVASPLCCPSRAAILSGLYPHQTGVKENIRNPELPSGTTTIASLLRKTGYLTGFVGKAHMGGDPRKWDFQECPLWLPQGQVKRNENPTLMVDGIEKIVPGHITEIIASSGIQWIRKHKKERWFLWLATTAPHTPWDMNPDHPYEAKSIQPPPLWPKGEPLTRQDWAAYYSTISKLDFEIGRVLQALEKETLLERTLILVVGDNGHMMGRLGFRDKLVWYEESARVPALARWPSKIKGGAEVKSPIVSVDLMATFCDIAGVTLPERREGVSFLPALTGRDPLRTIAYSEVDATRVAGGYWQMVRTARYKYVKNVTRNTELLYDLKSDPHEEKSLADDSSQAKTLQEHRSLLVHWLKKTP